MFALRNPNMTGLLQGEHPKFGPKLTHRLLIWASETFDRKKYGRMVTDSATFTIMETL